ncbi:hypothetical protein DPMN_060398 [Dreissena polymorpha]|uniref:Tropomodulin n=1 Tax=Dreissena polymorpha TaxID=45954 RepID=A0A9D4HFV5_DREPO|nr:hypothetical protein DPMN_060398 [Dreissena polymorpha]
MGQALAENSTLKELDLTNNRINANGMALLMAGLKYNETLEVLKVGITSVGRTQSITRL